MAEFTPSRKTAQDFNNGIEYIDGQGNEMGDALQAETINNLIESQLWTQEQADNANNTANKALAQIENLINTGDTPPPVGYHYTQFANEPTPAQRYAGTTWIIDIDYAGKAIIGSGEKYNFGATGGEESHTLTIEEMPAHRHGIAVKGQSGTLDFGCVAELANDAMRNPLYCEELGSSKCHNNMQPYIVVNIWKRIE